MGEFQNDGNVKSRGSLLSMGTQMLCGSAPRLARALHSGECPDGVRQVNGVECRRDVDGPVPLFGGTALLLAGWPHFWLWISVEKGRRIQTEEVAQNCSEMYVNVANGLP